MQYFNEAPAATRILSFIYHSIQVIVHPPKSIMFMCVTGILFDISKI